MSREDALVSTLSAGRRSEEGGARRPRPPSVPVSETAAGSLPRPRDGWTLSPGVAAILSSFLPKVKIKKSCGRWQIPPGTETSFSSAHHQGGPSLPLASSRLVFPNNHPKRSHFWGSSASFQERVINENIVTCLFLLSNVSNSHHCVRSFGVNAHRMKATRKRSPRPWGHVRGDPARPLRATAGDELTVLTSATEPRKQVWMRGPETRGLGVRGSAYEPPYR